MSTPRIDVVVFKGRVLPTLKTGLLPHAGGSVAILVSGTRTADPVLGWAGPHSQLEAEALERLVQQAPAMLTLLKRASLLLIRLGDYLPASEVNGERGDVLGAVAVLQRIIQGPAPAARVLLTGEGEP